MIEEVETDSINVFVPGRLCILGEHTDWIGGYRKINRRVGCGYTIVCTTDEGLYATCKPFEPKKFRYVFENNIPLDICNDIPKEKDSDVIIVDPKSNSNRMEFACDLDIDGLKIAAQSGGFFCYVAGTLAICLERFTQVESFSDSDRVVRIPATTGLEIINYKTTLPMKKGLSSSASVCVLVCSCFNKIFNVDSPWTRDEIMDIAYCGESMTGSQCGRMDQCVAMGQGVIGLMQFTNLRRDDNGNSDSTSRGTLPSIQQIHNKSELHFVVGNVMGTKNTVKILNALNACFPYAQNSKQSRMHRYAAHNYKHIWNAVKGLELGRKQLLGEAMNDSQSLFDNCAIELCPSELSSHKLHALLNNHKLHRLTYGMKGVGSQGDGSIQLLCKGREEQTEVMCLLRDELQCECFPLTIPGIDDSNRVRVTETVDAGGPPAASLNTTFTLGSVAPRSRPILRSPNHLRCALVVVDGNCVHRSTSGFAYLGNNSIPPSLLPLPHRDGSSTFLMSLLSELVVTHGVQRIAVVVSAPFKQWENEAFAASSQDDYDVGSAMAPAPLLGSGNMGSKDNKEVKGGKSFSSTEAFAASVGTQTLSSQFSTAFTPLEQYQHKLDDDPEADENDIFVDRIWTGAAEEFDYLRARTRFFFEDPKHAWSPYYTMIQALEMLEASAEKLGDVDILDVGNPINNMGFVPNPNNHDDSQSHSLIGGAGGGSKSSNSMLPHAREGPGTVASVASSSFGMLSRMVSSSGNAPILPISDPDPAPPSVQGHAATGHHCVYKKYIGPVLLCRGESMPLSAARGDTKLFAGMITAMNANWDKHCVFEKDEDKLHCRAGKPVIGLIRTKPNSDNSKTVGSWNVAVDKNRQLQQPESDLIYRLQPEVDVDPESAELFEFSGQALVPMRSLLKYLKHQEEKSDEDTNLKPDWIKTNRHMVDSIANGMCCGSAPAPAADSNSNSFYYKCNGYEMDPSNIYHVQNDAQYREAVLDVLTCA